MLAAVVDDGAPADCAQGSRRDRWRVRQMRHDGVIRSRVEGPDGQHYAPHEGDARRRRSFKRTETPG